MSDWIGRRIDQYHIEAQLGSGGMGVVYRALDTNLGRPVAIKVMHPHFAAQASFRQRFWQEARAIAQLDHPSIVKLFAFNAAADPLYMVMEYVPGGSLGQHIRRLHTQRQHLPLAEVLEVLAQVAEALAYAHRRGIVHRDIKPDNVLLKVLHQPERRDQSLLRAVTTDFGLVKLRTGGLATQTGQLMGTLAYMAPEQVLGQPVDGRADLYAVGVMLYQLVTGHLPCPADTPAAVAAYHLQQRPPSPTSYRPGLPSQLVQLLEQALAHAPEARFSSGEMLATALRDAATKLDTTTLDSLEPPEATTSLAAQLQARGAAGVDTNKGQTDDTTPTAPLPPVSVRLQVDHPYLTLGPGEQARLQLQLIHSGPQPETYTLSLTHLPAGWMTLPTQPIAVQPGETYTTTLMVHPPLEGQTSVGQHPFRLLATAHSTGQPLAGVAGALTITPLERFALELIPPQLKRPGALELRIHNQGNVALRCMAQARSTEEVEVILPGAPQDIPVGESVRLPATVRARQQAWVGRVQPGEFEIVVRSSTGGRQTTPGQVRLVPRLPPGVLMAGGLLGGVLLVWLLLQAGRSSAPSPQTPAAIAPPAATHTPQLDAPTSPLELATTNTATPLVTPTLPLIQRFSIGQSHNARPLEVVRFGHGPTRLMLVGGLHAGYAPGTVALAHQVIAYLEENQAAIPATLTLDILPNANPDSPATPGLYEGRLNSRQVDLNRNWDCNWAADPPWRGETMVGAGGQAPFSEPETSALRDFIMEQPPTGVVFWLARASQGLVSPGSCGEPTTTSTALTRLYATAAGYPSVHYDSLIGQPLNGDSVNWLDAQGIPAIAVLLPDYTVADWEHNRQALLALLAAYAADEP